MEGVKEYKKLWQDQNLSKDQIGQDELSQMIHKRSSSNVKWIFYISIFEMLALTFINILSKTDWQQLKDMGLYSFFIIVSIISYIIPLIFIYLFYRNYKRICVTSNIKDLINNILKTRRTVKYYIYSMLVIIAFSILYGFGASLKSDEYIDVLENIGTNGTLIAWIIAILFTVIVLGFFFLIYQLLYGIFLKRLQKNYKELIRD